MIGQRWVLWQPAPLESGHPAWSTEELGGQMCCLEEDVNFFMFVLLIILVNRE